MGSKELDTAECLSSFFHALPLAFPSWPVLLLWLVGVLFFLESLSRTLHPLSTRPCMLVGGCTPSLLNTHSPLVAKLHPHAHDPVSVLPAKVSLPNSTCSSLRSSRTPEQDSLPPWICSPLGRPPSWRRVSSFPLRATTSSPTQPWQFHPFSTPPCCSSPLTPFPVLVQQSLLRILFLTHECSQKLYS